MKDDLYKLFYKTDKSDPKDEQLTLAEWKQKAKELDPYVDNLVLQNEFEAHDEN